MSADLVRPSRDGDQFHYLRAARLALGLLPLGADLTLMTIEASAPDDVSAGSDVIDLALYYGASTAASAARVDYRQFKHSTRHAQDPFTASGLEKTLRKFAERYSELVATHGPGNVHKRFSFTFETNRPIADEVIAAIEDLAAGISSGRSAYLRKKIPLMGAALRGFASLIRLEPSQSGFLKQRSLLAAELSSYLPGADHDAPVALKDLVARKATTEFELDPCLRRNDVLAALRTRQDELFPAPNLIDVPPTLIERDQLGALAGQLVLKPGASIITADGGVGKSIITTQLGARLPAGSATFVYDCFANGSYRTPSKYRHSPKQCFVQLANEMASAGLCDLLVPSDRSDRQAYIKAFHARVAQASAAIAAGGDKAVLCLVFDAADNAQEAAEEAGGEPSFALGLLREQWPANVRIVLTSRPYRIEKLQPPSSALPPINLEPFTLEETGRHLRQHHVDARDEDVAEFQMLTSRNPRVQAAALANGGSLDAVLARLGPNPKTVEDTIEQLLEGAVARVRDEATALGQQQVDGICTALATLRPFVPLDVVAGAAGVGVDVVRSIVLDLQQPLLLKEDAVQFRDEPTETWFRKRFRPTGTELMAYTQRLAPLAQKSAYVAAMLPQLMLEAGLLSDLIQLALAGDALPEGQPIARRDVELQRLQFAIKAALRAGQLVDGAKLALKAGGEAAADSRQQKLLSDNTDLAARFLSRDNVLEQVARRQIVGGAWTGSEQAYEAALLSGRPELEGEARAKLRAAHDWLDHWARLKRARPDQAPDVEHADKAELLLAEINLHGPASCARSLRRWSPRTVSYYAGKLLAARLIDAGRFGELDQLARAARNDFGLILAIAVELETVGREPPAAVTRRAVRFFSSPKALLTSGQLTYGSDTQPLWVITVLVAAAAKQRAAPKARLANLLHRYLPKEPPPNLTGRYARFTDERDVYLRGYSLRSALRRQGIDIRKLMPKVMRRAHDKKTSHDGELNRFREEIGALLPWHQLWAELQVGSASTADLPALLEGASEQSRKAIERFYGIDDPTGPEIAALWSELVLRTVRDQQCWMHFERWLFASGRKVGTGTLNRIVRRAGRAEGWGAVALNLAARSFNRAIADREEAGQQVEACVEVARAVLTASEDEAAHYFDQAVIVAGQIGDEVVSRWQALLHLAQPGPDNPQLAYRLSRAAELSYQFMARDKYFDWSGTVRSISALSPLSTLPILSRWIDRRFAQEGRVLPVAVRALIAAGALDERDVLALFPMRADWGLGELVTGAVRRAGSAPKSKAAFAWAQRYLPFVSLGTSELKVILAVAADLEIGCPDLERRLERSIAEDEGQASDPALRNAARKRASHPRWKRVFAGSDPATATGLANALERDRRSAAGHDDEAFLREACRRVEPGKEVAFLNAYERVMPGLFGLRYLFKVLPPAWIERQAVQGKLTSLIRATYRRDCSRVFVSTYYDPVPIELAARYGRVSALDLFREAVTGFAELPSLDAGEHFQLVSLLSQLIPAADARQVLDFGISLLEPAMGDGDGDGPWHSGLRPPRTVALGLGGYIWAALSSPVASRRWQAAHVVRGLCVLNRAEVLDDLIALAELRRGPPFADAKLRFYELHGTQWLLIALARAAGEAPASVARHQAYLRAFAQRLKPHVVMRRYAAEALLSLHSASALALDAEVLSDLEGINLSALPRKEPSDRAPLGSAYKDRRENPRFHFGMDFPQYWAAPLARIFGLSQMDVEEMVEAVICDDWQLADNGDFDRDERAKRRFFDESWRYGRGSLPHEDELSFYLAYHALLTVAGKLLDTHNLFEDRYDEWDTFARWLDSHSVTRSDGLWLADRRDPTPEDCRDGGGAATAWPEPLRLSPLGNDGKIAVAGHWIRHRERGRHSVTINSALVTADKAHALASALITSRPIDYGVPKFGGDLEIDHPQFEFKGWTLYDGNDRALDEHDPWAAEVSTKPFAPAGPIAQHAGWSSDPLGRAWSDCAGGQILSSQAWSEADPDRNRRSAGEERYAHGERLLVEPDALAAMLGQTGKTLLVEEDNQYEEERSRYGDEDAKGKTRLRQIILIDGDGRHSLFRYDPPPRPKAGRRTGARRRR